MYRLCTIVSPYSKEVSFLLRFWGERWDLNPRPSVPQTDALPTELRSPLKTEDLPVQNMATF